MWIIFYSPLDGWNHLFLIFLSVASSVSPHNAHNMAHGINMAWSVLACIQRLRGSTWTSSQTYVCLLLVLFKCLLKLPISRCHSILGLVVSSPSKWCRQQILIWPSVKQALSRKPNRWSCHAQEFSCFRIQPFLLENLIHQKLMNQEKAPI